MLEMWNSELTAAPVLSFVVVPNHSQLLFIHSFTETLQF